MLPNRTMLSDAEGAALAPDVSGLPSSADVLAARLAFPAGLEQPEGSFRRLREPTFFSKCCHSVY